MEIMIFILFTFIIAFIVTFFLIPNIIKFSRSTKLFPSKVDRHSHEGQIPVFGGVAFFFGLLSSLLIWNIISWIGYPFEYNFSQDFKTGIAVIISLLIIFFIGVIDDLLSLTPFKKLISQIISVLFIIFLGGLEIDNMQGVFGIYELPYRWISIFFTIFVVVVITNAYNLIDGIDGLAAGLGSISSFLFGILFMLNNDLEFSIISFSLMGALLAFLRYNTHPASIFMGDTGSLVIGLVLSILAIRIIQSGVYIPFEDHFYPKKGPFIAIVILSVPLFDTFRIFCIRALSGYNPLYPDRNHIHHALLDLGFGHKRSAILLYCFSIIIAMFSYLLIDFKPSLAIFSLSVCVLSCMSIPFIILRFRNREL